MTFLTTKRSIIMSTEQVHNLIIGSAIAGKIMAWTLMVVVI